MTIRTNGQIIAGAGGASTWGDITGDLTDQTDLNEALESKLDTTQISNCITEIPQDIKFELNNGTLKLKAGSKFYVPNGSGVFDTVTIASDITVGIRSDTYQSMVFYKGSVWGNQNIVNCISGTEVPSGFSGMFYNTSTNNCDFYNNGSAEGSKFSLPLAKITVTSGAVTSIDQVFNGFGYIGSTVFALPGVKGLIPNGRNVDGTLKNIEFTNSAVTIKTFSGSGNKSFGFANNSGWIFNPFVSSEIQPSVNYTLWYKPSNNILYSTDTGTPIKTGYMYAFDISMESNRITSLTPKTAFHAVDYNDYQALSNKVDINTSNITLKQDIATAVNYDNISNCITEIPQDIKLELNDGTLTLKAGSKLYLPNGFESDGTTPHFDVITIDSDKIRTGGIASSQAMFFWDVYASAIRARDISKLASGSTTPSDLTSATWYDTATNKIKFYSSSTTPSSSDGCFPLCICTNDSSSKITSIDQVFNGFGYIGSTIFALPNVKGLIPNGRNADETLKSTSFTVSNVLTSQVGGTADVNLVLNANGFYTSNNTFTYDEDSNFNYQNNNKLSYLGIGLISIVSDKITKFTPKTTFHAVDYNDFEKAMLKEDWVKVSTLPASPDPDKFYYILEN